MYKEWITLFKGFVWVILPCTMYKEWITLFKGFVWVILPCTEYEDWITLSKGFVWVILPYTFWFFLSVWLFCIYVALHYLDWITLFKGFVWVILPCTMYKEWITLSKGFIWDILLYTFWFFSFCFIVLYLCCIALCTRSGSHYLKVLFEIYCYTHFGFSRSVLLFCIYVASHYLDWITLFKGFVWVILPYTFCFFLSVLLFCIYVALHY
jgi:hypothetical protein